MVQGTVKWFNSEKGYGFLTSDAGEDAFIHYTGVKDNSRRLLKDGMAVKYEVKPGTKGPMAFNAEPL